MGFVAKFRLLSGFCSFRILRVKQQVSNMMHTLTQTGLVDLSDWFSYEIRENNLRISTGSNVNGSDIRFLFNEETSIIEATITRIESDEYKVCIYISNEDYPLGYFDNITKTEVKIIIRQWIKNGYAKLDEYENFSII